MSDDREALQAELDERRARPVSDAENGREIRRLRQAIGASRWRDPDTDPEVEVYENEPASDPSSFSSLTIGEASDDDDDADDADDAEDEDGVEVEMIAETPPLFNPPSFKSGTAGAATGSTGFTCG